jgi:hypothetical protein
MFGYCEKRDYGTWGINNKEKLQTMKSAVLF